MIFMVDSSKLKKALTQIKPAVPKLSTLPILERVKMVASKNGVTIRGTDLDIAIQVEMPCHVDETGIGWAELKPMLAGLPKKNEKLLVSYDRDGLVVNTASDGFVDNFNMEKIKKDFPDFPNVALTTDVELDDAVKKVLPFASKDDMRIAINGVYLHGNGHLSVVATDGKRLMKVWRKWPADVEVGLSIPNTAAKVLAKMSDPIKMGWLTEEVNKGHGREKEEVITTAMFKSNGLTLATRLLDGQYPDYDCVIKPAYESSDVQVFLSREAFMEQVKDVGAMIKPEKSVTIAFEKHAATISGKQDNLTFVRQMETEQDIEDEWEITLDHKFLDDALKNMECEEIALRTRKDGISPVAILGDDDTQVVIMPRRI